MICTTTEANDVQGSNSQGYLVPIKAEKRFRLDWVDLGETPGADKGGTPQGLVWDRRTERLLLAVSYRDKYCEVFELVIDGRGYRVERSFRMPTEAVHAGGLDLDGDELWAVDYVSKAIYRIDHQRSFATGRAVVLARYESGLHGAGSLALARYRGQQAVMITEFMRSKRTYVVPVAALESGLAAKNGALESYRNGGFSQGIKWRHGVVWEANNRIGKDSIYLLDLGTAVRTGNFKRALRAEIVAPSRMVEDIAINGAWIYTSDESSHRLYRASLASVLDELSRPASGNTMPGIDQVPTRQVAPGINAW